MRFNSSLKGTDSWSNLSWMLCYMANAWYQRREDMTPLRWWERSSQTALLYLSSIDHGHFTTQNGGVIFRFPSTICFTFGYVSWWRQLHKVYMWSCPSVPMSVHYCTEPSLCCLFSCYTLCTEGPTESLCWTGWSSGTRLFPQRGEICQLWVRLW